MVAGRLGSSGGTYCSVQESCVAARGAESAIGGVCERGLLAFCLFLGVLGFLELVLVQLRNCLTFKMPNGPVYT